MSDSQNVKYHAFNAHLASFMSFRDLSWVLTSLTEIQSRNLLFTKIISHPSIVYQQPFSRYKTQCLYVHLASFGRFFTFSTTLEMEPISQSKRMRWFQVVSSGSEFFPSSSKFTLISITISVHLYITNKSYFIINCYYTWWAHVITPCKKNIGLIFWVVIAFTGAFEPLR